MSVNTWFGHADEWSRAIFDWRLKSLYVLLSTVKKAMSYQPSTLHRYILVSLILSH
jgi:hypothetical protein